jgi:hypothetical protein
MKATILIVGGKKFWTAVFSLIKSSGVILSCMLAEFGGKQ